MGTDESSEWLANAAKRLREKGYSLQLTVKYIDDEVRCIDEIILADNDKEAIDNTKLFIASLDERGQLNEAKRVVYKLRNPSGQLFYADINA